MNFSTIKCDTSEQTPPESGNATIVISDPDLDLCLQLEHALTEYGLTAHVTNTPNDWEQYLRKKTQHPSPSSEEFPSIWVIDNALYPNLATRIPSQAGVIVLAEQPNSGSKHSETAQISALLDYADDYLYKPLSILLLRARICALLRRLTNKGSINSARVEHPLEGRDSPPIAIQNHRLNQELTGAEYALFRLFTCYPNTILSKAFLCEQGLQRTYIAGERSVDVHVSRIPQKLCTTHSAIRCVRNRGYMYSPCETGPLPAP